MVGCQSSTSASRAAVLLIAGIASQAGLLQGRSARRQRDAEHEVGNHIHPFSVLHLTDLHVSTQYLVGATFDCSGGLCCTSRRFTRASTAVGPYGDIRDASLCDIPMRTLKNLLVNAATRKFTHVYLTGDFMPHTLENYTFGRVVREIAEQTKVISDALKGHMVFPCIGNHDDYAPFLLHSPDTRADSSSLSRLYSALWQIWGGTWIPEDAEGSFKLGGYYTALAQPGLRIFVLNTNFCFEPNWGLLVNPRHPDDQFAWLEDGLERAAINGDKVHLLGHIPLGIVDCKKEWTDKYQNIIARYRNIITGQFFGHQHWDMFSVDFAPGTGDPTGVQFAAPSATTYVTGFPSYRIMHFGNHAELLDMDTYLLNTTRLNSRFMAKAQGMDETDMQALLDKLDADDSASREWQFAYSFKNQYGLEDFSPKSFAKLIDRLRVDDELLSRYYRSYFQHRFDPLDVTCHEGKCEVVFYFEAGTKHPVVCEMYSRGTKQRQLCLKDNEDSAAW